MIVECFRRSIFNLQLFIHTTCVQLSAKRMMLHANRSARWLPVTTRPRRVCIMGLPYSETAGSWSDSRSSIIPCLWNIKQGQTMLISVLSVKRPSRELRFSSPSSRNTWPRDHVHGKCKQSEGERERGRETRCISTSENTEERGRWRDGEGKDGGRKFQRGGGDSPAMGSFCGIWMCAKLRAFCKWMYTQPHVENVCAAYGHLWTLAKLAPRIRRHVRSTRATVVAREFASRRRVKIATRAWTPECCFSCSRASSPPAAPAPATSTWARSSSRTS